MALPSQTPSYAQVNQIGQSAPGAPTLPTSTPVELPEQERPEYDESKVASLAQQHAAPGVRTLREAYQTAASRLPSNPQSRLTLRDAMKGYGTGLENVMGGARKTARAEYGQEYGADVKFAGQKYAAQVQMAQQLQQQQHAAQLSQFNMSYADYLKGEESQGGGHYASNSPPGHPQWIEPYTNY